MIGLIWTALSVMMASVLIVNLGLGEAISKVSGKILNCPTCLSFWASLVALLHVGSDPVIAVVLSILMAYLSNFFGIILLIMNKIYDRLWQRNSGKQTQTDS